MIESVRKSLINEVICKYDGCDTQHYRFKLEDDVILSIGGDCNIKTIGINQTLTRESKLNILIEEVDYRIDDNVSTIVINNELELSFETKTDSYIYIAFGNTIDSKLKT
jgi:hypothetical protein